MKNLEQENGGVIPFGFRGNGLTAGIVLSKELKMEGPKEMLEGSVPMGVINPLDPKVLFWNQRDMERFMATKVMMGAPGVGYKTYYSPTGEVVKPYSLETESLKEESR